MQINELKTHDWMTRYSDELAELIPEDIQELLESINFLADECDDIDYLVKDLFDQLNGWVKAGAIAHTVKYKKIYERAKIGISSFKQFCQQILKRSVGSINRLIEGAYVVVSLAKAGFSTLPQTAAQACTLAKFAQIKTDANAYYCNNQTNLVESWQQVIDKVPPHEISALKITEILDPTFTEIKRPPLRLTDKVRRKLIQKAAERGKTPNQLLEEFLDNLDDSEEEPEEEIEELEEEIEVVSHQQMTAWEADLQKLLIEQDLTVFNSS